MQLLLPVRMCICREQKAQQCAEQDDAGTLVPRPGGMHGVPHAFKLT